MIQETILAATLVVMVDGKFRFLKSRMILKLSGNATSGSPKTDYDIHFSTIR